MKTNVLCLLAIVTLAASCSKNNTATNNSSRDAFVGNYSMHDTIVYYGNTPAPEYKAYIMTVSALSGTSDQVVFHNIYDRNHEDTATISGTVATFTRGWAGAQGLQYNTSAATGTLTGTRLVLAGGEYYTVGGSVTYASGVGTKQ
ncbi:MAG: hypothetical protein JST83_17370 [Bacteroidetes bacterium]|nr:hypothetical protein [Bacteroidota bacterium]